MRPVYMTISGSPRKDGCSARMLRQFRQAIEAAGDAEFIHYDAYDSAFAPCTDCRACRQVEGCVMDDMDGFFADFEAADGIIIASPVYNMSFPAPMKAIIDRMQRYYSARFFLGKRPPIARHRPVALLLSAGSDQENGDFAAMQLEKIFTVTNCELCCRVTCSGTDRLDTDTDADADTERLITRKAAAFAAESAIGGIFRTIHHITKASQKN